MARFQREAQVLASLNHSNIPATGLEKSGGVRPLMMELVQDRPWRSGFLQRRSLAAVKQNRWAVKDRPYSRTRRSDIHAERARSYALTFYP